MVLISNMQRYTQISPNLGTNFFFGGFEKTFDMQQEDNGVDAIKESFLNLLCKVNGENLHEFDSFVRSALGKVYCPNQVSCERIVYLHSF